MTNELSEEEFKDLTSGCSVMHLTESDLKFISCYGSDPIENNSNRQFLNLTSACDFLGTDNVFLDLKNNDKEFKVRALNEDAVIMCRNNAVSMRHKLNRLYITDNANNKDLFNDICSDLKNILHLLNSI